MIQECAKFVQPLIELIDHEYCKVHCEMPEVCNFLLEGGDLKCANVHSLSETLTSRGAWCTTNQSRILPSHSSRLTPGASENRNRRSTQHRSIRISINARFFPAQFVGPYENGKNAAVLCSPAGAPVLSHRSGRNASGVWKFRGSR